MATKSSKRRTPAKATAEHERRPPMRWGQCHPRDRARPVVKNGSCAWSGNRLDQGTYVLVPRGPGEPGSRSSPDVSSFGAAPSTVALPSSSWEARPRPFGRLTWPGGDLDRSLNCATAMWTTGARPRPPPRPLRPRRLRDANAGAAVLLPPGRITKIVFAVDERRSPERRARRKLHVDLDLGRQRRGLLRAGQAPRG